MKKLIKFGVLFPLMGIVLFVIAVNLLTPGIPEVTEAELARPIQMDDGSVVPLRELIARSETLDAGPPELEIVPARDLDGSRMPRTVNLFRGRGAFHLGLRRLARGNTSDALAIWRAIPPEHHDYARAQRFIGFKLYDRALGQPAKGVAYVNRSLRSDPLSGNAWQDAVRIYWAAAVDVIR